MPLITLDTEAFAEMMERRAYAQWLATPCIFDYYNGDVLLSCSCPACCFEPPEELERYHAEHIRRA